MSIAWKETLGAKVLRYAATQPDKFAVLAGGKAVTYAKLGEMIKTAACNLEAQGLTKGSIVLISALMKAEYVAAFLACKCLGLVVVPLQKNASLEEVSYILELTEGKLLLAENPKYNFPQRQSLNKICQGDGAAFDAMELPETVEEKSLAEILFTSGTTGKPKGVMLSEGAVYSGIFDTKDGMDMRPEDILLHPLPLNHSFGLRVLRAALYNGQTICLQNGFSFAKEIKNAIEVYHCNTMVAVSAGFEILRQQLGEGLFDLLKNLRYIEFSAGAVPKPLREELVEKLPGVDLYNTWGSTETMAALFLKFSEETNKLSTAGKPAPTMKAAIEEGRLLLKSPTMMSGYYKNEALTKETLRGSWLYTGDEAAMDEDGYVSILGRMDDVISVGGEKISPLRVEEIACSVAGVAACGCVGVADPKGVLGQVPVLFVVKEAGVTFEEKALVDALRTKGNACMVPQGICFVDSLPLNYMGKLDRKGLKEQWEKAAASGAHALGGAPVAGNGADVAPSSVNAFAKQVRDMMLARRSVRAFLEKPIEKEIIEDLLAVAKAAPSGHNMQTWRFSVLQTKENIATLQETTAAVAKRCKSSYYGWLNPQCLLIVSNDRRNVCAVQDSSAAIENIMLLAQSYGLGSCWLNSLIAISDEAEIRALLDAYGIPKTHIVYGIVALGYPEKVPVKPAKKDNVTCFVD